MKLDTAIRMQYVRKVTPRFSPELIEGTAVVMDVEAIAFASHCALWLAKARCAFPKSRAHREAAKALVCWVLRHDGCRRGIDAPNWGELGQKHNKYSALTYSDLNGAVADLEQTGWLVFPEHETPTLTIPPKRPTT